MAENVRYAFASAFPLNRAGHNGAMGGIEQQIIGELSFWGERKLRIEVLGIGADLVHLDMEPDGNGQYHVADCSKKMLPFLECIADDMTAVVYAEVKTTAEQPTWNGDSSAAATVKTAPACLQPLPYKTQPRKNLLQNH